MNETHTHICMDCKREYVCALDIPDLGFDADMDCRWYTEVCCPTCMSARKQVAA